MRENVAAIMMIAVYLIVDLVYITLAKPVYATAVQKVQGSPMVVTPLYAMLAYTVMMVGWYVLIATRITPETPLWKAATWGAIFGLCMYGTFNFTNAAMFGAYKGRVVLQDLLWGISAATGITLAYTGLVRAS